VEGVTKITTKRGDRMAVVLLEDPTGKLEATLFPRTYAELSKDLESPETFLVLDGTVDVRAGQLQLRADTVKKTTVQRVIENARTSGFFDDAEAARGIVVARQQAAEGELDVVNEEGNVVAGERMAAHQEATANFHGPLARWIIAGLPREECLERLGLTGPRGDSTPDSRLPTPEPDSRLPNPISLYTITLPDRAPRRLLLELKAILQTFPGKERVQLRIGEQNIPLPITVNASTVLEHKIEELLERYAAHAA
jgi:hypothetical protein